MVFLHDLHRRSALVSVTTMARPRERIAFLPFLPKDVVEQVRRGNLRMSKKKSRERGEKEKSCLGKRLQLEAGCHVGLHVLVIESVAHVVLGHR